MIFFVRHGNKEQGDYYNEKLKIQDEPLSETGKQDALRIKQFFKDIPVSKIYVSEYVRTQQTAEPLARQKDMSVIIDARVNEIDGGEFHRLSEENAKAAFPEVWNVFSNHLGDIKFPGGESGADVKARQDSFLSEMETEKENIVVVCHDGFVRLLMCNILGLPVFMRYRFKTQMGGISIIEYDGEEWNILKFNQTV